jgi:hypothetical protein
MAYLSYGKEITQDLLGITPRTYSWKFTLFYVGMDPWADIPSAVIPDSIIDLPPFSQDIGDETMCSNTEAFTIGPISACETDGWYVFDEGSDGFVWSAWWNSGTVVIPEGYGLYIPARTIKLGFY